MSAPRVRRSAFSGAANLPLDAYNCPDMFKRQTEGAVVCTSCGSLVGVRDATCLNCGRRNPGLWGYAPLLRRLGQDLGFVSFITIACGVLYVLTLLASGRQARMGGLFTMLAPDTASLFVFGAGLHNVVVVV